MTEPSVSLLTELVRRPSVTPDDAGCQLLIASRLTAAGFDCEAMTFGDVTNLWARLGTGKPVLCFAGHTDVVPPGRLDHWDTPPFDPVIRGDFLYGRGAADMKSGLAAMIVGAEQFVAANPSFNGSIAFLITSDEEGLARDGTRRVLETLVARDELIDWCVIGEPSSASNPGDVVRIGRRGSLNGRLIIRGVQGHVAYPDLIDNPIRRFSPVLAELHDMSWDSGNDYFPPTSFQVVDIESGVGAINVTPPDLKASFNFRYSTEWDHIGLQDCVEQIFRKHNLDFDIAWQDAGKPFLTSHGRLTEAAVIAVKAETGYEPRMSTGGGTSDGRFISPTGADVIELGPVNDSIHKVNEHVRLADMPILTNIYRRIMEVLLT
jgi:succinyl-diaminopimelate desuccinylase